jgi:DNA-binding HxlR family transcriptional regulator
MAQLTYDELRLLRQLERGDQMISDNEARGDLNRLVDEGYVMRRLLNPSQTVYSITAKGRAVLHEVEGND